MGWKLTLEDFVLRESDLTIGDAERLEKETDTTWRFITPTRSASHAKALLKLALERKGLSPDEAEQQTLAMTVDAYFDLLSDDAEDDLPAEFTDGFPQPAAGTSTDS